MAGSTARRAGKDDRELTVDLLAALGPLELVGLQADVRGGVAYLRGSVASQRQKLQAEELARVVPGIRQVVNELALAPVSSSEMPREVEVDPLVSADVELEGLETIPGTEPDFNLPIGTNDPAEATDGSEPYYPPTDPVVKPVSQTEGGIRVLGGFARGSMDSPIEPEDHPARLQRGDDEIAEDVRLALEEDAATTDLDVHVVVRRGIVHLRGRVGSIDEAELAEEVSARVPGVVEVREELEVEGL